MASLKEQFAHVSKYGLARSNRFQIIIPLPVKLQERLGEKKSESSGVFSVIRNVSAFLGSSVEITRGLEIMTESTEFPGRNLTTTDVRYNGDIFRLPYAVLYNTQPITFRCSQDMHEKNIIDEWMEMIFDPKEHTVDYHDNVVTDITINQLDTNNRVTHSIILKDAMPTVCNPVSLSNEDLNTFSRISAQFVFRKYLRSEDIESGGLGVGSLTQTPLGPAITPILSSPVVQKGLEIIETNTGLDLDGEAVKVYNRIDAIMRNTTGSSTNQSASLYESMKASVDSNNKINSQDKATLISILDNLINTMRG